MDPKTETKLALEAIAGCYDDALDYLAEFPDEDIPF